MYDQLYITYEALERPVPKPSLGELTDAVKFLVSDDFDHNDRCCQQLLSVVHDLMLYA